MNNSRTIFLVIAALAFIVPQASAQTTAPKPDTSTTNVPVISKSEYLDFAEEEPSFVDADLQRNMIYPPEAIKQGIEGMVVVKAYINDDGIVARTEIYTSAHPLLNEAALTAVKNTKFAPGKNKGQPVKSSITIPIRFVLRSK